MATITNTSGRRFRSNTLSLLPGDSEKVTTIHALCYAGVRGLKLEFDADDSFDGINDGRLASIRRSLGVEDLDSLLPKKKSGLNLGRGRKKKAETPVEEPDLPEESEPSEDSEQ